MNNPTNPPRKANKYPTTINAILEYNKEKLTKLYSFLKEKYNRIEPVEYKGSTFLFFVLDKSAANTLCGVEIDSDRFIRDILTPKILSIAKDEFSIYVFSNEKIYDFNSEGNSNPQQLSKQRKLWLLPSFSLAIKLRGETIENLVSQRTQMNLIIILVLISVLIIGTWFVFRNIKKEIELAQIKSEFVSNVSHELRTPLSLISMFAETLEMDRVQSKKKSSITKQALILPPGAVGISLAGQPIIAQGPTGVVYVPAATNPVLVRANYADAQIYGIEHTLDWRVRNNLLLSTIFTWLRSRDTETGSPPNIEGGTPPADGYLKIRYSVRQGRIWIEPVIHAADRQERLSSLDLEDRRTGAGRSRTSMRRFFLNGATARGLVAPGPDARPGTADDVLLATGETVTQVQNRVLGVGVDCAPLFRAVPGYLTLNLRSGIRLGERQDVMVALTNIADRNYRGVSWGVDAPGRSLSPAAG